MKNLNPGVENGRTNGVAGLGLKPDPIPNSITIKVSNGHNEYQLSVPSNSTFADIKSVIAKETGLKVENHKLLFRGKEKDDEEYLKAAGVKDSSKLLLVEDTTHDQKSQEEVVAEIPVISKGGEAVAQIKKEVDKLSEQVSALQNTLDSGKKADEKTIIFLTEMLMRQLLKLDGIEAEGEGRIQRKMEVRRVQSLVDTMDVLKSRNSNPSNNVVENSVPVTTQWESFEPANGSANSPSGISPTPIPAHATVSTSPHHVPSPVHVHSPSAAPSPSHMPSATPSPGHMPSAANSHVPSSSSSYGTSSAASHYAPNHTPSYGLSSHAPPYAAFPHETPPSHAHYPYGSPYTPNPTSSYGPPSHAPPYHYDAPSYGAPYAHTHYAPNPYVQAPYPPNSYETAPYAPNPYAASYHTPPPMQPHDPSGAHSYDPSSGPTVPSSTKVTRDWERFE